MSVVDFPSGNAVVVRQRSWWWGALAWGVGAAVAAQVVLWGVQEARPWPIAACEEYYSRIKPALTEALESASAKREIWIEDEQAKIESACKKSELTREEVREDVKRPMARLDTLYGDEKHQQKAFERFLVFMGE